MKKLFAKLLKFLTVIAFWVIVWLLLSKRIGNELLFPSPTAVTAKLKALLFTKDFWMITATSLLRILYGIVISLLIGTSVAIITSVSPLLRSLIAPIMNAAKAVPVACFIILTLLWLDTEDVPVFITVLIVTPILWANVSQGIISTDKKLCEVAQVFKFSDWKKIKTLYIPSVFPYFIAACKSALGMAWKAGIAAEVLALPQSSIGREIYYSKLLLDSETLFAWTLVIIVLSFTIEKLLVIALEFISRKTHIVRRGNDDAKI